MHIKQLEVMKRKSSSDEERQDGLARADVQYFLSPFVKSKLILLRVFTGGADGMQSIPLTSAVQLLPPHTFIVEKICIKQLKDCKMNHKDLVDWLLNSHIHLVLSHFHQGYSASNERQLGWNMEALAIDVKRLTFHPGFPNGIQLKCPVFTQDKHGYIAAVPEYCNPTFCVPIFEGQYKVDYHSEHLQR